MGILNKILGRDETQADARPPVPEVDDAVCPHTALTPHWDNLGDMGKKELATYRCEACGETFSYSEAEALMDQPAPALLAVGSAPEPYEDNARRD